MKRFLGICFVVFALCALSITSANAAGPWCIDFSPAGYCDKIEVARDANLNLYGHWDDTCDGTFGTLVQGSGIAGVNNLVGEIEGYSYQFYVTVPSRSADVWYYDGVNAPVLAFPNQQWKISPGQCPHSAPEPDLPALLD